MSETNPVLENVDDAIDVIEKFIEDRIKVLWIKTAAMAAIMQLRAFLQVPDNYAGDQD